MKKIMFVLVFLTTTMLANAQNSKKLSFGLKTGINISNVTLGKSDAGTTLVPEIATGVQVGMFVEKPLAKHFAIQSGLYFSTKGFHMLTRAVIIKSNSNYLQMPLLAVYKIPLGRTVKATINLGPYFAYGVGGKSSGEFFQTNGPIETFSSIGFKTIDYGITTGAGIEYKNFLFNCGYELGLADISQPIEGTTTLAVQNTNVFLTFGLRF